MLLIACPWCGPRAEIEFRWGGESHLARPERPAEVSDATWGEYLYLRKNAKGVDAERWVHAHGCRQWFNLVRNTLTHEIVAVYPIDETADQPRAEPRPGAEAR